MSRSMLVLSCVMGVLLAAPLGPLGAAELPLPMSGPYAGAADCGPCGCLRATYVYHRQLESTYGLLYDPRNYDTTEPLYYFGPMRRYPQYFVDGMPVPSRC